MLNTPNSAQFYLMKFDEQANWTLVRLFLIINRKINQYSLWALNLVWPPLVLLYCHLIFQTGDWKGSVYCVLIGFSLLPVFFERKLIFLLSKKKILLDGFYFCRTWKTFQKPVETVKWALLSVFYKRNFPLLFIRARILRILTNFKCENILIVLLLQFFILFFFFSTTNSFIRFFDQNIHITLSWLWNS